MSKKRAGLGVLTLFVAGTACTRQPAPRVDVSTLKFHHIEGSSGEWNALEPASCHAEDNKGNSVIVNLDDSGRYFVISSSGYRGSKLDGNIKNGTATIENYTIIQYVDESGDPAGAAASSKYRDATPEEVSRAKNALRRAMEVCRGHTAG